MSKPTLAIISQTLRRDLQDPLKYFKKINVVHFYRDAGYGDMRQEDFAAKPIQYASASDLVAKLAEVKPDIIQAQEPYASRMALKNDWAIWQYVKRTKTPFMFPVFENRPINEKFGPIVGFVIQRFTGWFGRQAQGIVNLNQGAKDNLVAAGIPVKKITRLNWGTWGIDLSEFKPNSSRRSKRPLVFFVGRVSAAKGVPELLAAWPEIFARFPTAQLVIGGPGSDKDLIEEIKRTPATKYLGPIKNAELPQYFQEAWVTVAPSTTTKIWEEQVGMVNLQSLACETPVVTTDSGAIPEYVGQGNGAAVVPEHDPKAISEAVIELFEKPKTIESFGKKGRRWIKKNYEVKENIGRDEEYILKLLAKSGN